MEGSGEDGGQGTLVSGRERLSRWRHKGRNRPRGSGLEKVTAWGQDTCDKAGLTQGGTSAGGMGRKKDALKMWVSLS